MTVSGIEEYRTRVGVLPESLDDAGLDDPLLHYEAAPAGYRLEARSAMGAIVFTEGDDLAPYEAKFWDLQRGAGQ